MRSLRRMSQSEFSDAKTRINASRRTMCQSDSNKKVDDSDVQALSQVRARCTTPRLPWHKALTVLARHDEAFRHCCCSLPRPQFIDPGVLAAYTSCLALYTSGVQVDWNWSTESSSATMDIVRLRAGRVLYPASIPAGVHSLAAPHALCCCWPSLQLFTPAKGQLESKARVSGWRYTATGNREVNVSCEALGPDVPTNATNSLQLNLTPNVQYTILCVRRARYKRCLQVSRRAARWCLVFTKPIIAFCSCLQLRAAGQRSAQPDCGHLHHGLAR